MGNTRLIQVCFLISRILSPVNKQGFDMSLGRISLPFLPPWRHSIAAWWIGGAREDIGFRIPNWEHGVISYLDNCSLYIQHVNYEFSQEISRGLFPVVGPGLCCSGILPPSLSVDFKNKRENITCKSLEHSASSPAVFSSACKANVNLNPAKAISTAWPMQ